MFLKIGHRGARAYETENTLESFGKAVALGANAVELDLRTSKDGALIVSHDDSLKRVYGKDVLLSHATLNELKDLTGGKIVTLEEVLRFLKGKVEKILVELKETGLEKKVADAIGEEKLKGKSIVVSFHVEALSRIRELDKKIEAGLIYARFKKPIDTALNLDLQYLVPLYRFIHRRDVQKAHKNNLKVIVWTINRRDEAMSYIAKDVDGIATDKPDIFKGLVS